MEAEKRLKFTVGDLIFQVTFLQAENERLQEEAKEMQEALANVQRELAAGRAKEAASDRPAHEIEVTGAPHVTVRESSSSDP
jgi:hypothetical protein